MRLRSFVPFAALAALAATAPGCIALSARVHGGAVADSYGRGVQAGLTVGIGVAGERSAVIESIGVATGTAPKLGLAVGLDYVRLPERHDDDKLGWRVGFGGVPLGIGGPVTAGLRVATLFVLRDRSHSESPEKCCFSSSTRSVRAIGVEGAIYASTHEPFDIDQSVPRPSGRGTETPDQDQRTTTVGGGVSVSYELYSLNRMW